MSSTGFVWHELYMWHDTGTFASVLPSGNGILEPSQNAETPATKRRIKNLLDVVGLTEQLVAIAPRAATEPELLRVHSPEYVEAIKMMSKSGGGDARMDFPFGHTPFGPGGYEIAALAAGGVLAATEAVVAGAVKNAYSLVRPPGHHAERDHGLGFCIFNNGALAARHAREALGIGRVAIVDWDVHHGNGAEHIFWDDPEVLTISIHQDRMFPPDSGDVAANGGPGAEGTNLNIPLPPGSGVGAYGQLMDRIVGPALERFRPELIIVPCGFDAGALDILGRMMLHSVCFAEMTASLMDVANRLCGGRIVLTHEGGYHGESVPFYALAVIETLSGISTGTEDPWMMIMSGLGQQELQPHQNAAIERAAELVANVPT